MYPATDDRGWKIIQQTIDASDYYVVIVGGMYGSVREDTGKSWTEEEYEYARATGKTILAFPREPSHITVPNAESQADRIAKHRDFVNRLLETHHCKRWTTKEVLASEVATALHNAVRDDEIDNRSKPGWYRGDQIPSPATLDEFAKLSAENRDLKDRLAAVAKSGGTLLDLVLASSDTSADGRTLPFNFTVKGTATTVSARGPLAVPLQLRVKNRGPIPARNVVAQFKMKGVRACAFYDPPDPNMPFATRSPSTPISMDPSRHVHASMGYSDGRKLSVIQRVRSIGIGAEEDLVPMELDLYFRGEIPITSKLKATIEFSLSSDDGPPARGSTVLVVGFQPEIAPPQPLKGGSSSESGRKASAPVSDAPAPLSDISLPEPTRPTKSSSS